MSLRQCGARGVTIIEMVTTSFRRGSSAATRPAQTSAAIAAIAFLTFLASGFLAAPATAQYSDEAAWLYKPTHVAEIDLDLPQASWDALVAEPREYVKGRLELRRHDPPATYVRNEVGVKLKGSGSFRPLGQKAAFKIKLDKFVDDQTLLGLEKLTLNNMNQDPSMLHEMLAYDTFRAAGVPAWRTGYAFVSVNGDPYGVYLNLETPDEISLALRYTTTQHLYEGEYDDKGGTDVVSEDVDRFEIDEGDEEDLSDLEALAAAVEGDGDFSDRVQALADLKEMTRMWAVEKYIGHWDGYSGMIGNFQPNNYFLHSNAGGRFTMLPWGTDQTWGGTDQLWDPRLTRLNFEGWGGVMFNECLNDDSCFALYRRAVREVRDVATGLDLDSKAASTAALLAPWQGQGLGEYSLEEIEAAVSDTRAFIAARPSDVDAWLPPPPDTTINSGPTGAITVNEATFTFSGTPAADTAKVQCRIDSEPFADCTSPKAFTGLSDGPHTAEFRAEDEAGNQDPSPATRSFTVDTTVYQAKISKVSIKGPKKVKKGKKATYKVRVANSGNIDATGVKLQVKGKGVKARKSVGKITAGKSKTVKVKVKPKKPGKIKASFKVSSKNAGGKTVKKKIKVKK